uniref:Uncharacterized protein n=1 Tax=Pristionchus pacificus TaxID=54126 RepID=A0A2A6BT17_PRIPA|eukprot:PDM69040.1 hypothetical protein PRIPAC_47342 [Pristionchus pacificus]
MLVKRIEWTIDSPIYFLFIFTTVLLLQNEWSIEDGGEEWSQWEGRRIRPVGAVLSSSVERGRETGSRSRIAPVDHEEDSRYTYTLLPLRGPLE